MKEKIAKIYSAKTINYIFILFPIIELMTSIQKTYTTISVTIGSIYKFAFVIYALIYFLVFNKYRRKETFVALGGIAIYSILNLLITTDIFTQMVSSSLDIISKLLTFTISFMFFISLIKSGNKLEYTKITYVALLYTILINIATITNTAIATYENDLSLGTTGWYYSANELNVLLAMFLPITLYNLAKRADVINILTNGLLVYSLLSIGTKTSLFAVFVALAIIVIYTLINMIKNKSIFSKRLFIFTMAVCIFSLIIMPYTASYNHFIKRFGYSFDDENMTQEQTDEKVSDFIYNGRNEYLDAQKEIYKNTSILERTFGLQMENRIKGEDGINYKLIEMDPYDIAISYGIIGAVIYYLPIALALFKLVHSIFARFKFTEKNILTLISVVLVLCISTIAGHVLLSSTIVIFLAYWLGLLNTNYDGDNDIQNISLRTDVKLRSKNKKKRIIICTQRLAVGGMERAYINLLNMSDIKENFEVWAYVTYVQDKAFLKQLPEDINVHLVCNRKWTILNKINSALKIVRDIIFTPYFDYAICYGHSNGFLSKLTRRASKNNIIFVHADLANRTQKQIKRLNNFMRFNKFKKVICVSEKAKESYIKLFNNTDVQVINNYINAEEILNGAKESIQFNVDEEYTNFVMVCRLEEKSKKISRVIQATKRLLGEEYKFRVYIIGTGPDEKMYTEQIASLGLTDNIIFLGAKLNPYPYMKKCSALLFTSIYEGYGIVLDEARILKIPFVSTDVADAKKMSDDKFGIVCENSDAGVYNGMKTFLADGYNLTKNFNYTNFNNNITQALNNILED